MPTKFCRSCGMTKSVDGFAPRSDRAGLRYRCRACDRAYSRQRYRDCPDVRLAARQRYTASRPDPARRGPKLGSDPSYRAMHKRVQVARGKAAEHRCAHCPEVARQWAYDHTDPTPLAERVAYRSGSGTSLVEYSADPSHYLPLCRSCHTRFDRDAAIVKAARELVGHG